MHVPTQLPPTIFETFPRLVANKPLPSTSSRITAFAPLQARSVMSSNAATLSSPISFSNYKIDNTTLSAAAGVSLSNEQKVITGSVFDLFGGRPSLRKLSLWLDDATFSDPLTIAEGRKQYVAQWYGLKAVFSDIQRLNCSVTSAGNPIEISMKNKYTVKGIGSERTIDSKVKIWTEGQGDQMRIKRVEDRWDDNIPDGAFAKAMRNLNSVTVPTLVSVPKSVEEEEGGK